MVVAPLTGGLHQIFKITSKLQITSKSQIAGKLEVFTLTHWFLDIFQQNAMKNLCGWILTLLH